MKKGKTKGSNVLPCTTYEWETVATNLDEFLDVSVSCWTYCFLLYFSHEGYIHVVLFPVTTKIDID